ncbi:MAG TPA: class I SAM-dependent rRNA methyltransferase, partial [Acidobacteriota bacterium]|nr:class I SAM-dependent rRNA methyltransferase [Acidobacteriota bacterium]
MNPFAVDCQVHITPSAVRRVRQGHLWIYAGEIEREPANEDPVFVRVSDTFGNTVGFAFYSRQSQIRLRLFTRGAEPPSPDLFKTRISNAVARRRHNTGAASACRLVFGEGDLLPGIIVDRYGDCLVVQTLSRGAEALKPLLVEILTEIIRPAGILQRNDVRVRRLEGLEESRGILWGKVPGEVEIDENGVRFIVDLHKGQKTGFFLDQSENRITSKNYARGRALDCFTHTGGFALHFARTCSSVLAIDVSPDCLALARRNAGINGLDNIAFLEGNVFDLLRSFEHEGKQFDTICLDPPAFAKNRKSLFKARSGYKEITLRALKLLAPEGILITSSCSYHMTEPDFLEVQREAARDCRRYLHLIER